MNEKDTQELQDQTDTIDNSTNTNALPDSNDKVHTSELSPTVQEYIDYSNDMGTLITIFIVGMIGIGLVVGILACNIFARYFIS